MASRRKAARRKKGRGTKQPAARRGTPTRRAAAKGSATAKTRVRRAAKPQRRAAAPKRRPATKRGVPARRGSTVPASPMTLAAPNGRPVATGIGLTHHHMDFSTHDLEGMRKFFVETLGFTNVLHIPEASYMTVFVTPTSSLGFMPPATSAPDQWQPPGEPNLYFFVSDVDSVFARLSTEGVAFDQAPTDMPWGHRLAILRDPEGRRVCLAQNLKR